MLFLRRTRARFVSPITAACFWIFVGASASLPGQQRSQGLVSCKPISQKTSETGCWILASQPIGVPDRPVFWTIDLFPSKELAEHAKSSGGTVIESLGKVWLLSVGEKPKLDADGVRVTQIGPLDVHPGLSYTAQFMEATLQPGMVSKTHLHAGVEAFYTEKGETCLETPDGVKIGKKGSDIIVPEGVPMELTAVGREPRLGLILVLHDASKPPTTLVDTWKSKQLCTAAK